MNVVLLHRHPEYKEQCCNLINEEWKRSNTARIRTLESSCDTLPTSLVLVRTGQVLGHCRLSRIPLKPDACFIETMVIDKNLRGRGLGSYLMKKAEEYCKCSLQLTFIYLSTKNQVPFYSKLGYCTCEPVSVYGNFLPATVNFEASTDQTEIKKTVDLDTNIVSAGPAPPPLPSFDTINIQRKTYMCKTIN